MIKNVRNFQQHLLYYNSKFIPTNACTLSVKKLCFSTSQIYFSRPKFDFDTNKFNDVHIRVNHIQKFNKETQSDLTLFQSALKGLNKELFLFIFYISSLSSHPHVLKIHYKNGKQKTAQVSGFIFRLS